MDYNALYMFLNQFSPDLIPVLGTNLGEAIDTAVAGFDKKSNTDKVIILITDGEDNEEGGIKAAKKAAEAGIRIFVFGMGDPSGGPVPMAGGTGFQKDKTGQLILSKLDENGLKEIANISGGTYVRSTEGDLDLDRLYFAGIRKKTTAATLKSGKIKVYEERFYLFLIAALILLLGEGLLKE
jgi:Ca-activated chloride channel family protein